jgi:hypothetical protein
MAPVVGCRGGSPCGRLRPADVSTLCIRRQGEVGMVGGLMSVTARRSCYVGAAGALLLHGDGTGRGRCI